MAFWTRQTRGASPPVTSDVGEVTKPERLDTNQEAIPPNPRESPLDRVIPYHRVRTSRWVIEDDPCESWTK